MSKPHHPERNADRKAVKQIPDVISREPAESAGDRGNLVINAMRIGDEIASLMSIFARNDT